MMNSFRSTRTSLQHLCHLFESNQRFDLLLLADVQEMRMTTVCSFSTASIDCLYSHRCACRLTLSVFFSLLLFIWNCTRDTEREREEKRKEKRDASRDCLASSSTLFFCRTQKKREKERNKERTALVQLEYELRVKHHVSR